jgi:hypothetical protein
VARVGCFCDGEPSEALALRRGVRRHSLLTVTEIGHHQSISSSVSCAALAAVLASCSQDGPRRSNQRAPHSSMLPTTKSASLSSLRQVCGNRFPHGLESGVRWLSSPCPRSHNAEIQDFALQAPSRSSSRNRASKNIPGPSLPLHAEVWLF